MNIAKEKTAWYKPSFGLDVLLLRSVFQVGLLNTFITTFWSRLVYLICNVIFIFGEQMVYCESYRSRINSTNVSVPMGNL